ncbi:hypothetical protein JHK87_024823 [Glycine soja]|nr:hypothetical protein JHK87_024823 [Glycine soja]
MVNFLLAPLNGLIHPELIRIGNLFRHKFLQSWALRSMMYSKYMDACEIFRYSSYIDHLKRVEISQLARSKTLLHSRFSFSSHLKSARNRSIDTHIAPHSFRYCRKPLAGTHRTSYRRKVEENPTLLLELCGSKKPYTALGTVVDAQSSKLSTLPVNKEIKTVELMKATGWVYLSLSGADPR